MCQAPDQTTSFGKLEPVIGNDSHTIAGTADLDIKGFLVTERGMIAVHHRDRLPRCPALRAMCRAGKRIIAMAKLRIAMAKRQIAPVIGSHPNRLSVAFDRNIGHLGLMCVD